MRAKYLSVILVLIFSACQDSDKNQHTLFELQDSHDTGIDFINEVVEENGFNILTYRNFYNGGGVAIGDINNDSLPDIYFTSNQNQNKLYINKGNFKFEDITDLAQVGGTHAWSTGVSMADINGDGFLDIYVCNSGDLEGKNKENELFINNGDGTFSEKAKEYNLNNEGYSTHAAFFDFDQDGDLDCYILNNSFKDPSRIELYQSMRDIPDVLGGDRLMRNDDGYFTDVSQEAGIYSSEIGFGLGVAVGDLNMDNLPDIYVSNDFWERDYLYLNNGDGTFTEDLNNRINYCSVSSMGADISDINGDGSPEIFTTDMLAGDNYRIKSTMLFDPYHLEDLKYRSNYHYQMIQNCLHLNDGQANFQEIALLSGVAATDWSWGALLFDFENNGSKDIFVSNGINKDVMSGDFRDFIGDAEIQKQMNIQQKNYDFSDLLSRMPSNALRNVAFQNKGDLQFENVSNELGFHQESFSNGAAYADLDNDGDLDLLVNNVNMPSFVYKNNSNEMLENHYLKIEFKGQEKNPFGIGCKVSLKVDGQIHVLENFTNRGFQSSIEPSLIFGLGELELIEELSVIWPDLKEEKRINIQVNQTLMLDYENAQEVSAVEQVEDKTWFKDISESILDGNTNHLENRYNDFDQEVLLTNMLSTEGPRMIVGDVDGDGLEDFILLGAANDADKLFIQKKNGTFQAKSQDNLEGDKGFESTCGSFLDYDLDGDLDLLIASGGNQINMPQINFIVRLYVNDGQGNFEVDPSNIPPVVGNFSTLEVSDFDKDGDPDFFLGARNVLGNYGLMPHSYLISNENGRWKDITAENFENLGMVTDASWNDIDQDGDEDLLVVGDWMSVHIFNNNNGVLEEPRLIPKSTGWWRRIEAADLDDDGDIDFILGNWGRNSKFQASETMPLTMQVSDFDGNDKSEFIINWKAPLDTEIYPFASKMDLTMQMPALKRENLKYERFSTMKYEDLFDEEKRMAAQNFKAENLSTSILWNNEDSFSLQPLPIEAQISPVYAIVAHDFDKDGTQDIFLAGNFYGLKPQVGRHDASRGILLRGMGDQNFTTVPNKTTGINIFGEVRDAWFFSQKLWVARNNNSLQVYRE